MGDTGPEPLDDPLRLARRYLAILDRLLPERAVASYVTGSVALGAYVPGRSDVDVLVLLDRPLDAAGLRRVRLAQVVSGAGTGWAAVRAGHVAAPGTVNASFVLADEITRPVTRIRPVASHVGTAFRAGEAFDVNPVVWRELADGGVAVRGPAPADLDLDPEPDRLRDWNRDNLRTYWRPWAERAQRGAWSVVGAPSATSWLVAWGALGVARLDATIATAEVVSKEAAGVRALEVFDDRWHPVVAEALAFWRLQPTSAEGSRRRRLAAAGRFVEHVVEVALARTA